jgi:hypothetical protein
MALSKIQMTNFQLKNLVSNYTQLLELDDKIISIKQTDFFSIYVNILEYFNDSFRGKL